jgi:hypothetical protein
VIIIVLGVFGLSIAAMRIVRHFGVAKWQVSLGLLVFSAFLYATNIILIQYFIRKHAPDLASTEEIAPGLQTWELSAGLGVVPRWVSVLGLLAISALITGVLPWVIELFN